MHQKIYFYHLKKRLVVTTNNQTVGQEIEINLPSVVIVGRPNVGKSSLFNRIVGERRAITEDEPGTTRDRLELEVTWKDKLFRLVDTGGYETREESTYSGLISDQIDLAVKNADLILLCVDSRDGLTASDFDIAKVVRVSSRPYILLATKADTLERETQSVSDTASLGFGDPLPVSAIHDHNIGLLLDRIIEFLPQNSEQKNTEHTKVAIIGRPNVGKSTLVNAFLGQKRVIVSDVPGTTRDAIDTQIQTEEGLFDLIDTAGIRRPGKRDEGVEKHSVIRVVNALERADVAVLLVDVEMGISAQDTHIAGLIQEHSKGVILAANKIDTWDTVDEEYKNFDAQIREKFRFLPYALIAYVSAEKERGLSNLLRLVQVARIARSRRVQTGPLNATLAKAFRDHSPPVIHNKRLKLRYVTQVEVDPPVFVLFVNDPKLVHFSYHRYLERSLREAYDFEGTAIKLLFKRSTEDRHNN